MGPTASCTCVLVSDLQTQTRVYFLMFHLSNRFRKWMKTLWVRGRDVYLVFCIIYPKVHSLSKIQM